MRQWDSVQKYKVLDVQNYILHVILYGCKTWSLTLREERRLRVFENRVLRGIFWAKERRGDRGVEKTT